MLKTVRLTRAQRARLTKYKRALKAEIKKAVTELRRTEPKLRAITDGYQKHLEKLLELQAKAGPLDDTIANWSIDSPAYTDGDSMLERLNEPINEEIDNFEVLLEDL